MASIDEIILRSINPFDNIRSVNFWHKQQAPEPIVESIHQEAIAAIEATLDQVAQEHRTRTVILDGDSGSGKTYLLGRLKKAFNHKAFFAYIPAFPQSDYIWRHILRYTVDSLVQVPDGQKDSQLMLWLKSALFALKQRSIKERIWKDDVFDFVRSDRQKFINKLKDAYKQAGIYNADSFFGILHDLAVPELSSLAYEWLRGDSLSEESLQTLKVRSSIDTEQTAREIIANFGRIAADTQPIILCFDELESVAQLPDGSLDLQTLFKVNSKIHNEDKNFLVIISILTDTWHHYKTRIDQSHKFRIDEKVSLGLIKLEQAELLLASRLFSLHHQANSLPTSPIYPLTRQYIKEAFPGGKTSPGDALDLGRDIFHQYKKWLFAGKKNSFIPRISDEEEKDPSKLLAAFKLKWQDEFTKVQKRIIKISYLSSPELIQMLQVTLAALQVEEIRTPFLTKTKFDNYSLSHQLPGKSGRLGIIWTEDANMITFFNVMNACQKAIEKNSSISLRLIRAEELGSSNTRGYKLYRQNFTDSLHHHIKPNLVSVHYLATYHSLVKDAREGDLVIGGETISLRNLQALIRESKVLYDCQLLQDLGIIPPTKKTTGGSNGNGKTDAVEKHQLVKDFMLNLVITQQFMGRKVLIQNTHSQFPHVNESVIDQIIDELCQEKKIKIINLKDKPENQLVCWIPNT